MVQFFSQFLSPPVLSAVFPCSPRYVYVFVAASMVSDEMDVACSTNAVSKKCMKKCSENRKRVAHLQG